MATARPTLPFYPACRLEPCATGSGVALRWQDLFLPLDWTNEYIYFLNGQPGALRLTKATVIPYAKFFFAHVRGRLGCFTVVEPDDAIDWLPSTNPGHKAAVRNLLSPVRYLGIDAGGLHRLTATIIFSDYAIATLFRTVIRIAPRAMRVRVAATGEDEEFCRGQLLLCEEQSLVDDLCIELPPRPLHYCPPCPDVSMSFTPTAQGVGLYIVDGDEIPF